MQLFPVVLEEDMPAVPEELIRFPGVFDALLDMQGGVEKVIAVFSSG